MSSRGVPTIDVVAQRLLPHLAGAVFISHLRQEEDGWAEVARWDAGTGEFAVDPALLPEQSVLDYVASSSKLTYLPQGEEGSEWCLAGARCVLFLPFWDGDRRALLYIAGRTVDAFSVEGVRAAHAEFVNVTSA